MWENLEATLEAAKAVQPLTSEAANDRRRRIENTAAGAGRGAPAAGRTGPRRRGNLQSLADPALPTTFGNPGQLPGIAA